MSRNALRNLVRRTLDPGGGLTPYLPSRFEDTLDPIPAITEETPATPRLEQMRPVARHPGRSADAAAPPSRTPAAGPSTGSERGGRPVREPPATGSTAARSPADGAPPSTKPPSVRPELPHREPGKSRDGTPPLRPATKPDQRNAAMGRESPAPARVTAARQPEPPAPQPIPAPRAPSVRPADPASTGAPDRIEAGPGTEPVVHITIGRVEVRVPGSEPASPRPASRPARHVMSLDEYLERRARESS